LLLAAFLLSAAAAAGATHESALVARTSSKSTEQFASCFMSTQAKQSRPLWIVPDDEGGGRISNEGARGVSDPYHIRFRKSGSGTAVEVFIAGGDSADELPLLAAVRSCW
jgi:hypothetical protein